jgi:hypothetical protein
MSQTRGPSARASGLDWQGARFEADEARVLIMADINSQSSACVHFGAGQHEQNAANSVYDSFRWKCHPLQYKFVLEGV